MNPKPKSALHDLKRTIADLQRRLTKSQKTVDAVTAERDEAFAQQIAAAQVLQVINSSPGDLAPVFDAMLDRAMRLCEAAFGVLWTYDGDRYRAAAVRGAPAAFVEFLRQPLLPHYHPGTGLERALRGENLVINEDMSAEGAYGHSDPMRRAIVDLGGARSHILVALRRDETLLGAITIYRQEVRPFSKKQIALLENFAQQAVIAIENARLITETREALEQQTATAEVLGVINSSPGDLTPVFDAMLEKAMHLCEAVHGTIRTYDGEVFHEAARSGEAHVIEQMREVGPIRPGPNDLVEPLLRGERIIHIVDVAMEANRFAPANREAIRITGARTWLTVALRKDTELLGFINVYRRDVRPFTDKQIALLQNFAAQAVIAMENARLITETREALEQQTATAEILQVINSSPGDLAPVFDAILEKAHALCGATYGSLQTYDGEFFRTVASRGLSDTLLELLREPFRPGPNSFEERLVRGDDLVHIPDVTPLGPLPDDPLTRTAVETAGLRTLLLLPLRKEAALVGYVASARSEVRPFTDKQIALLQNFAAQAVIAMENARLITETREALEQQTATADVLGVINSSPGELTPVFDTMLEKATALCDAPLGTLWLFDGEHIKPVATRGASPAFAEFLDGPRPPNPVQQRQLRGAGTIHMTDLKATALYEDGDPLARASADLGGIQTVLSVPLRREDKVLGLFGVYRQEIQPFSDKQIALIENFAAQAVIAMENARLITETREALEQQTATAEVLQVINSSPGNLVPVFSTLVDTAARLCNTSMAGLAIRNGDAYRYVATRSLVSAWDTYLSGLSFIPERGTVTGRTLLERRVIHVTDLAADPEHTLPEIVTLGGLRTMLAVPLPREGELIGVLALARQHVEPFTDRQISLAETFATQAAIAIENARLITETREARDDAEAAFSDLKAAQANLIQAEKMASLGQLTAGIAHEIKNPLNFVNNFASLSVELLEELKETTAPAIATLDEDKRADVDDTMELLTGNLEKIAEHGKRADNIVKSMLEHSRGVSGERREVDLNNLVDEALNLAYHGARAQDQSFNITLERAYAESLQPIELAPQEMTRVFLNLIGNGFYAATKRARENGGGSYRPTLTVTTSDAGDTVEVRVRDNGIGIPAEIRDKLFQPFFTTKPTGEGTGLGLSISYDIVTQQHGGTITVESEPGAYTEFTIRLPRQ